MALENLDICLLYLTFFCGNILTQCDDWNSGNDDYNFRYPDTNDDPLSPAVVKVRRPPSICIGPESVELLAEYDTFRLTCKADGAPAVTYSWRRNGVALYLNDSNIRRGSDGDITIYRATRARNGFYQCFASNNYGTALSKVAHVRGAYIEIHSGDNVVTKTVQEGRPFVIQTVGPNSFQTLWYVWDTVKAGTVNVSVEAFNESRRVIQACNGDLYGAYALKEDELDGRIYKSTVRITAEYERLNIGYTRLHVSLGSGTPPDFPPNITYVSKSKEVALTGGYIELRCIFSGKPLPEITWSGPRNDLPSGRSRITRYNTLLNISNISESDEGDYVCSATNNVTNETASYTHNIRVEAVPIFRRKYDRPQDVNITEGGFVTFHCSAYAKPKPTVVWLQNGEPIDVKNPPKRFVFSDDLTSLTIRDVCRDCVDRETKTDLMVIQCNASNVHGYAFAQGYLNVLVRIKVTIRGTRNVFVDFLEAKEFVYLCRVTSDPSAPATMKWKKTEPHYDLVRDEPPYISVNGGVLIIMVYPNCSLNCSKYLGEYRCVGESEYSNDHASITISHRYGTPQEEESWAVWEIILVAVTIGLVLLLIGMFLGRGSKRRTGTVNIRAENRRLPNLPSMYERIDYDSFGIPLVAIANRNGAMPRALSMYERIGYASIDQVLNDMANTSDTNAYNGYESIDATHGEANSSGRPLQYDNSRYDDMGYSIPLEEGQNRVEADHYQLHGVNFESSHSRNFPLSNHQSGSNDIYSDLSRRDVNPYLELENSSQSPPESSPYLGLEISSQSPTEIDPYLDLGISNDDPREANPYLNLDLSYKNPREVEPEMDLTPKEVNHYLDLIPGHADPHLDTDNTEITLDMT